MHNKKLWLPQATRINLDASFNMGKKFGKSVERAI